MTTPGMLGYTHEPIIIGQRAAGVIDEQTGLIRWLRIRQWFGPERPYQAYATETFKANELVVLVDGLKPLLVRDTTVDMPIEQSGSDAPTRALLRFLKPNPKLPPDLIHIAEQVHTLALDMVASIPPSAERTAGLRKLLEAKDCLVRAMLPPED